MEKSATRGCTYKKYKFTEEFTMIINTNMMAINANRNLGINNGAQASSMEKLSSGLRINRAGDDAAGLAISEKMRSQIRGLDQASRNAQDGISLIQTSEGAMGEIHEMLQRMRELAIQAANDTYQDSDREKLDLEMQELYDEIGEIAGRTEFNGLAVLGDDSGDFEFQVGANANQTISVSIDKIDINTLYGSYVSYDYSYSYSMESIPSYASFLRQSDQGAGTMTDIYSTSAMPSVSN